MPDKIITGPDGTEILVPDVPMAAAYHENLAHAQEAAEDIAAQRAAPGAIVAGAPYEGGVTPAALPETAPAGAGEAAPGAPQAPTRAGSFIARMLTLGEPDPGPAPSEGPPVTGQIPPTLLDHASPTSRARMEAEWGRPTGRPNDTETVVRIGHNLHNQFPSADERDAWVKQQISNPDVPDSRRQYLVRGREMARLMDDIAPGQNLTDAQAKGIAAQVETQELTAGPDGQYQINMLSDPNTGRPAIDLTQEFPALTELHYLAMLKKAGYDAPLVLPESKRAEIRKQAEEAAVDDLYAYAATLRNVTLLDSRQVQQQELSHALPIVGEVRAFVGSPFGGRTTTDLFSPTPEEAGKETEGTLSWLVRMGVMDATAPWLKELRVMKLGLPISDEEKDTLDRITAMQQEGVPLDEREGLFGVKVLDRELAGRMGGGLVGGPIGAVAGAMLAVHQGTRERIINDYLSNYLMLDEVRQWIGVGSYLTGRLMGLSEEDARGSAQKASNSWASAAASIIPYFFDIDLLTLGTLGAGAVVSKGVRVVQWRRALQAAGAVEKAALSGESVAKTKGGLFGTNPAAHSILSARTSQAIRAALDAGSTEAVSTALTRLTAEGKLDKGVVDALRARPAEDVAKEVLSVHERAVTVTAARLTAQAEAKAVGKAADIEAGVLARWRRAHQNLVKWETEITTVAPELGDLHAIYQRQARLLKDLEGYTLTEEAIQATKKELDVLKGQRNVLRGSLRNANPEMLARYDKARRQYVIARNSMMHALEGISDPAMVEKAILRQQELAATIDRLAKEEKGAKEARSAAVRALASAHPEWVSHALSGSAKDLTRAFKTGLRDALGISKKSLDSLSAEKIAKLQESIFKSEAQKLANELRRGADTYKSRGTPVLSGGVDFVGVKRGLPADEFSRFGHTVQESVTGSAEGGKHALDAKKWYDTLVARYGQKAVDTAVVGSDARRSAGASRRGLSVESLAQNMYEGMSASAKANPEAMEAARALAEKVLGSIAAGAKGQAPDEVVRLVTEALKGDGKIALAVEDLASLGGFEHNVAEQARLLRAGEEDWRTVLTVLQSEHTPRGMGSKGFYGGYHVVRRYVEGTWRAFSPISRRIGPTSEQLQQFIRAADNIGDRYQEELIQLVNRAVERGIDPRAAVIEYLTTVEPLKLGATSTFLNGAGGKTVYTRARRAILADPETWKDVTAVPIGAAANSIKEMAGANAPLLGLSRLFLTHASDQQARLLYHEARRLLVAHENAADFFQALRATTSKVLRGDGIELAENYVKFDRAETKNLAMGARLFIQGAIYDDLSWLVWRTTNGVVDAEVAADINKFLQTDLGAMADPNRAMNAMLLMGLSLTEQSVKQSSKAAVGRTIAASTRDTKRMIEVATVPTASTVERLFLPSMVRKEIGRDMDRVIKELDMFHAEPASAGLDKVRALGREFFLMWRKDATTGLLIPNPRYYIFNHVGDWSQMWAENGLLTASKVALHNFWTLIPGIGKPIQNRLAEAALKYRGHPLLGTVTEAMMNPWVNRLWNGAPEEIIELGGRRWSLGNLREEMATRGVFDTHLDAELHDVIREQGKLFERRLDAKGLWGRAKNWQRGMEDFGIAWQQRQRSLLMLQLLDQGKTMEEATVAMRTSLYDWKHGISSSDVMPWLNAVPFQRFFWLYGQQVWRSVFEGISRPGMETLAKALTGNSRLSRLRQQYRAFTGALPDTIAALTDDDHQSSLDAERNALGHLLYPEWALGKYPIFSTGVMSPEAQQWSHRVTHGHGKTQSTWLAPPVIGLDGLDLGLLPFKALAGMGLAATGADHAARNWFEQSTTGFFSMLYPVHREAVETMMQAWGLQASIGTPRPGEWRVRDEEAMLMTLIMHGSVRQDPSGEWYANKVASTAFRFTPIWLNRFPTILKYAVTQNPNAPALYDWDNEMDNRAAKIAKAFGYFALNFGGLAREYQTNPEKQLIAKQARLKFALERDKEQLHRDITGAPWLPDLPEAE